MEERFRHYLEEISLPVELYDKVENILRIFAQLSSETVEQIFVSEYLKPDGSREYESLWCFSRNLALEATDFVVGNEISVMRLIQIAFLVIRKKHYDFTQSQNNSELYIEYDPSVVDRAGYLKASGTNCDHLKNVALRYLAPRSD